MTPVLEIERLHHAYGPTEVLHDVTLRLAAGEVLALLGPSGCGKTTLLHLAAGLLVPQEGRVGVAAGARRAGRFQQPRLLPWQRTLDNIALGLRAARVARRDGLARAAAMGHALGLDDEALAAYPHQLSGGMQSRAALARALVLEPALLLIDEPFAALDIGLKAQLHRLLLDHCACHGTAVLMITHDVMEAVRLADRVIVMAAAPGRVVHETGVPGAAMARDDLAVHAAAATLLGTRAVRASFDLPALA
jgi:NitT/TauT family transport system ATP-binding protein